MRITWLAAGALLAACGHRVETSAGSADRQPVSGPLTGSWRASDGNLEVTLELTQQGDSVSGTGSYRAVDPGKLGCGGETIPASGKVTLAGALAKQQFGGRFGFVAGGWTPPYTATWIAPDSLRGGFMSVDRGQCPLILVRLR